MTKATPKPTDDGRVHEDSLPGSPEYGFYEVAPVRACWRFG
jgi:hypothetical protein